MYIHGSKIWEKYKSDGSYLGKGSHEEIFVCVFLYLPTV